MKRKGQVIAIVGRPNVGKSALFNRIVGRPVAIVEDTPGVTRDRHFGKANWQGRSFWVVDTGGLDPAALLGDKIEGGITKQALAGVEQADQVVFLVDSQHGIHPLDRSAAKVLRASKKPIILAVNKCDTHEQLANAAEFYGLGVGEPIGISAIHGIEIDMLLDKMTQGQPKDDDFVDEHENLRIAVIGRPNVGKSSIVNKLLGEERSLVSDVPGTTRDAVDSELKFEGQVLTLVDTAGLRKKGKAVDIEYYANMRTLKAIENCDVAVLVIDAMRGVEDQDEHLAGLIESAGRACVIAVNKWDAIDNKDGNRMHECTQALRYRLHSMDWAPVVFVSAISGQRLPNLVQACIAAGENHARRITTGQLNKALEEAMQAKPPPTRRGRELKIKYISQTSIKPPAFALFLNDPLRMHFSYLRYLKNRLREKFGFDGSPMIFMLRKRK